MPSKFECEECGKHFASNFSVKRHKKDQHGDGDSDNDSVTTYDEAESNNDSIITSSSSPMEDESESDVSSSDNSDISEEEDVDNSVIDLNIKDSYMSQEKERNNLIQSLTDDNMSIHESKVYANTQLYQKYQKAFRANIIQSLLHCDNFMAHPVMRTIMNKANKLDSDSMDRDEAIRAAVTYRKHLVNRLFPTIDELSRNMNEDKDELSTNPSEDEDAYISSHKKLMNTWQ